MPNDPEPIIEESVASSPFDDETVFAEESSNIIEHPVETDLEADAQPEPQPAGEQRPKTHTEMFTEAKTTIAFRYRQCVEIMRAGKDQLYDQMVLINTCKSPEELQKFQFEAADAVCQICDIMQRLNAGILTGLPAQEESKIIKPGG